MTDTPRWLDRDGKALSCKDKIATLDDNLDELLEIAQDALEDAAVMGVDVALARQVFVDKIATLEPRFAARSKGTGDPNNANRRTEETSASGSPESVGASKPAEG